MKLTVSDVPAVPLPADLENGVAWRVYEPSVGVHALKLPLEPNNKYGAVVSVRVRFSAPLKTNTTLPTVEGLVLARTFRFLVGSELRLSMAPLFSA